MDQRAKSKLRLAYDADAERRNARDPEAWRFATVEDLLDRMRSAGLQSVLDVGCGTGQLAEEMSKNGMDVTAVDLSPANVMCAQARGISALVGDLNDLPFDNGSFHGALAFNSLLHVPKRELGRALAEIRRVVVPGGLVKIVVWGGFDHEGPHDDDWLTPPRFFSFFTDEAFACVPTPGFAEIETVFLRDQADSAGLHPQTRLLRAI